MNDLDDIETLFRRNYAAMHRLAVMILHDVDAAADVVQDVFTALLRNQGLGPVSPSYLMNSVRNRCINRLRDMETQHRIRLLISMDDGLEDNSADERLTEISMIISDCLSLRCRQVMEMRFRSGMSYHEIAEELDISEAAVYKHLRKGLDILRKKLDHNG